MSQQLTRSCGYWRSLYAAFYAPWCYIDVVKRWSGLGLLYLLFLILIWSVPFSVRTMAGIKSYIDDEFLYPYQQMPLLRIINGYWTIDGKLPYLIKNPQGSVIGVLDNHSEFAQLQHEYPDLQLLITQDQFTWSVPAIRLFFMQNALSSSTTPQAESFGRLADDVFSAQDFVRSARVVFLKWLIVGSVYPVLVAAIFGFLSVMFLVSAMLGKAVAHIFFQMHLSFVTSCRLLIVASTVPLSLFSILVTANIYLNLKVYWILIAIYFCYAVIVIRGNITGSRSIISFSSRSGYLTKS